MITHKLKICFLFLVLSFNLSGQTYTSYYTGIASDTVTIPLGGVCLMGGATEHDEAMKWFLKQSSGGDILILRASGSNGYNSFFYRQLGVKVHSVESIVCNSKLASDEPYIQQKIRQAEAIWFAGGDQWDYISYWRGTAIDSLINDAITNRHIVIGGTSAGMAIQGGFYFSARNGTITSAEALANPFNTKMKVDSAAFIQNKYLQDVITDTHYDDPDRSGRHVAFLARILTDWGIEAKGIGSDAYAAVCIDTSGLARCYGDYPKSNDYLYFLQVNCESENTAPENCSLANPLDWNLSQQAIKVYKINGTPGGENTFSLKDWKTGSGGSWENWYVSQGILNKLPGDELTCSSSSSADPETQKSDVQCYPNPVKDGLLYLNYPGREDVRICFFDLCGRKVKSINSYNSVCKTMDVSDLNKGIYVMTFQSGKEVRNLKLVVN
jgi:cyanophycinase-like exopeptidase